jgi:hypothetical protein
MPLFIKVFIGSPSNVSYARDIAKQVFGQLNHEMAAHSIHFACQDYKDLPGHIGTPQEDVINPEIREASLILLFFGNRTGIGTVQEYELGSKLYRESNLLDLMVYFESGQELPNIREFKESIFNDILYHDFNEADLREILIKHLRFWCAKKIMLFKILGSMNPTPMLLKAMEVKDVYYSDAIIELLQNPQNKHLQEAKILLDTYFAFPYCIQQWSETDLYKVSRYLYEEILADNYELFRHRQFVNPIHQHLSKQIRESANRSSFVTIFCNWLTAPNKVFNTSRNFAAFELGMIRAEEAIPSLLNALENDRELLEVRYYATMALGMIRNKKVVNALVNRYFIENHNNVKEAIINTLHFLYKKL